MKLMRDCQGVPMKPDWDKDRATATLNAYKGELYRRPNGTIRYQLLAVDEISCGWGIRVRAWPSGRSYVLCHNAIVDEKWKVV